VNDCTARGYAHHPSLDVGHKLAEVDLGSGRIAVSEIYIRTFVRCGESVREPGVKRMDGGTKRQSTRGAWARVTVAPLWDACHYEPCIHSGAPPSPGRSCAPPARQPARRHRGRSRVRSHRRFRDRATEYVSEYGIKWMSGNTKRRCDRALAQRR
jgi:hypothetical protein